MSSEETLAKADTYGPAKRVLCMEISKKKGVVRSTLTRRHQDDLGAKFGEQPS